MVDQNIGNGAESTEVGAGVDLGNENSRLSHRLKAMATTVTALALAACSDAGAQDKAEVVNFVSGEAPVVKVVDAEEVEVDDFADLFAAEDALLDERIAATDERIAANKKEIAANKAEIATNKEEIAATDERIAATDERITANKEEIAKNWKAAADAAESVVEKNNN